MVSAELNPQPEVVEAIRAIVGEVPDPEIPVVTLTDLGIFRGVSIVDSQIVVTLTPTYSGCPATEAILADVRGKLSDAGFHEVRVQVALDPAWSTDWISPAGREKLRDYGIAPPAHCVGSTAQQSQSVLQFSAPNRGVRCPRCATTQTEVISQFGSTPCKALYRCIACREPFDYFKPF